MMRVCQRQRRHFWESLRESLSVPPFTCAFLKSLSSRGLSAIAELFVYIGTNLYCSVRRSDRVGVKPFNCVSNQLHMQDFIMKVQQGQKGRIVRTEGPEVGVRFVGKRQSAPPHKVGVWKSCPSRVWGRALAAQQFLPCYRCGVCTLPLSPERVAQRTIFRFFE